jgi:hypothetical protein
LIDVGAKTALAVVSKNNCNKHVSLLWNWFKINSGKLIIATLTEFNQLCRGVLK